MYIFLKIPDQVGWEKTVKKAEVTSRVQVCQKATFAPMVGKRNKA